MRFLQRLLGRRGGAETVTAPPPDDAADEELEPGGGGEGEAMAARRLVMEPVGDHRVCLRRPDGAVATVSAGDADLLRSCREFRPLGEHSRRYAEQHQLGEEIEEELTETLADLSARGLMIGKDQLVAAVAAGSRESPPAIASVVICTRGRPRLAARAAESVAAGSGQRDALELVVLDDSVEPEHRSELRGRLAEVAARHPRLEIRYGDLRMRERYAEQLVAEVASGHDQVLADATRLALFAIEESSWHLGASRNTALLDRAGQLFLSIDDDVVADLVRPPWTDPGGLLVSGRGAFGEPRVYADAAAARAAVEPAGRDLVAAHAALLGRSLSDLFHPLAPGEIELEGLASDDLERLLKGTGRVAMTMAGLCGDLAHAGTHRYLFAAGQARRQLLSDWEKLRGSRQVVFVAETATVVRDGEFIEACSGFDHRSLLAPYFPFDRFADHLFALMCFRLFDDVWAGHLPAGVRHDPPDRPAMDREALFGPTEGIHTALHVGSCVASYRPSPAEREGPERMRSLGRWLRAIAAAGDAEYRRFIRERHIRSSAARMAELRGLVERHAGEPGEGAARWAEDAAECIERWERGLVAADAGVPRDLVRDGAAPARAWELARLSVGRYGRLLEAWPQLFTAARRLAARGVRPTAPLGEQRLTVVVRKRPA
jgi:hypothetical protein